MNIKRGIFNFKNAYLGRNFVKLHSSVYFNAWSLSCINFTPPSSEYLIDESSVALAIYGRIDEKAYMIREGFRAISERKDERRPGYRK